MADYATLVFFLPLLALVFVMLVAFSIDHYMEMFD
jgi:hypothetical protein